MNPSPLMGEGYEGLAALPPSRSWVGVTARRLRPHAPPPSKLRLPPGGGKLRYPSPIKGEGAEIGKRTLPPIPSFVIPAKAGTQSQLQVRTA